MRALIINSFISLLGLSFALLTTEVGARFLSSPVPYIAPATPTSCIGLHGVAPNTTSTYENPETGTRLISYNTLGLRGDLTSSSINKPIFVIGDSIVEALEVEESDRFTNRIQDEIGKTHPEIHVWNLGLAGSGTLSQLCTLERALNLAMPQLVILVFFENDLGDNVQWNFLQTSEQKSLDTGYCENHCDKNPTGRWGSIHRQLREWSSLYRITMGRINPFIYGILHGDAHFKKTAPLLRAPPSAVVQLAREESIRLIENMRKRVTEAGSKLIIANMPTLTSLDNTFWTRYADRFASKDSGSWSTKQNFDWLNSTCKERGWLCLSLLDAGLTPDDYFPTDQHLNSHGHEKVAKFLVPQLIRLIGAQQSHPF